MEEDEEANGGEVEEDAGIKIVGLVEEEEDGTTTAKNAQVCLRTKGIVLYDCTTK